MLAMSSCHEQNASISSSCLLSNNVEEIEQSMRHETLMNEDSKTSSSSSSDMHMCLMAKGPKVTPTLNPNTSSNEESNDDEQEAKESDDDVIEITDESDDDQVSDVSDDEQISDDSDDEQVSGKLIYLLLFIFLFIGKIYFYLVPIFISNFV
jgi:hypothetical protein